jgi:hypothetical protein
MQRNVWNVERKSHEIWYLKGEKIYAFLVMEIYKKTGIKYGI